MNRKIGLKSCQLLAGTLLVVLAGLLSACNPDYRGGDKPILHTTISADGQMVAALLNAGTDKQLLRVRNLTTDTTWRTVLAPPLTQTIRFGLQGHELLLTHRKPDWPAKDYLSKFDLDKPETGLQKIYETEDGLAFPVEVTPGQVMVRTHKPADPKTGKMFLGDSYWILVGPGEKVQKVGPESVLPYAAPNIVGSGFFWTEDQIGMNDDAHPRLLRFPLPGGSAPDISQEKFDKNTFKVICDRRGGRCLRQYISNLGKGGPFIYDLELTLGTARCQVPGVAGTGDGVSITPDGKAAIMSLASASDKPRHVVVIRIKSQQCEAVSVQHINFEER